MPNVRKKDTVQIGDRRWKWSRSSDPVIDREQSRVTWLCQGGSDYWRLTSSGRVAHNGHSCLVTVEGDFTLEGEFSAELTTQYDQVGLIAIESPGRWFKTGFELDGRVFVGGVFTRETSDWSLAPGSMPACLKLVRNSATLESYWRTSGPDWILLRQLTLEGRVQAGFYSASPKGDGFRATIKGLHLAVAD